MEDQPHREELRCGCFAGENSPTVTIDIWPCGVVRRCVCVCVCVAGLLSRGSGGLIGSGLCVCAELRCAAL